MSILKLVLLLVPICSVACFPEPSEEYLSEVVLKGPDIYRVFWKNEGDTVTFEIHVKTKGWVGFGLSPNGGMTGSDIFTAWIQDGKVIYHDRYALGFFRPIVDKLQDWTLIFGKEVNNYSVYKFSRTHKTCDLEQDRDIKQGTVKVIWAFSHDKPISEKQDIAYHGFLNRGSASLNLRILNLKQTRKDLLKDVVTLDLTVKNYVVPHIIHTTYACSFFKLDTITTKHHAIGGEAILNGNGYSHLHHLILYFCDSSSEDFSEYLGKTGNCVHPDVRRFASKCRKPLFGWAVGGRANYLPSHIGIPIEKDTIIMTESHYDNSELKEGIIENSGYRLWLTRDLRQYDAGIMAFGMQVSPKQIIPPGEASFTSTGRCPEQCLTDAFDEMGVDEVKIVSYLAHAHLSGVKIRARVFRGDTEVEYLVKEDHYDFDYQDFYNYEVEKVIRRGDRIDIECDYNTLNKDKETLGGYATQEEMCIVFFTAYPKFSLRSCYTIPTTHQLLSLFDDPSKKTIDWSKPQKRKIAQEIALSNEVEVSCEALNKSLKSDNKIFKVPLIKNLYVEPEVCDRFPIPSEKYPHDVVLKGPDFYKVFWRVVEDVITFEIHVKTKGWAGFGLSPNGNMAGSDVIMTWMGKDGIRFDDRHIIGYSEPLIDEVQNWHLITGRRYGEYLIVKFSRNLDTCDVEDIAIGEGTVRIVWSYNDEKVVSDTLVYHGFTSRGTKSIFLLTEERNDKDDKPIEGAFPFDIRISNFSVPHTVDTFYHCEIFKLPKLDKKHHVVVVEPLIDERNPSVPHHLIVYGCTGNLTDEDIGKTYECYNQNLNIGRYDSCEVVLFAWAVGGERQYYPENTGYPIGRENDVKFVRLELHYDNPSLKKNIIDSSGLRLWLTDKVRKEDLQSIKIGHRESATQIIPPFTPSFTTFAACASQCISESMERGGVEEVTVVSLLLHAHLLGKAIKVRHFRQNVELEPLADDKFYDFNFQSYISLRQPRKIRKGDWLSIECNYDSSHKNTYTLGGLGTQDEMCLSFLLVYPAIPLADCLSHPQIRELKKLGDLNEIKWTRDVIAQHQINVATPNVTVRCMYADVRYPVHGKKITLESVDEYTSSNSTCKPDDDQN